MKLGRALFALLALAAAGVLAAAAGRLFGVGEVGSWGLSLGARDGLGVDAALVELVEGSDERLFAMAFVSEDVPPERRGFRAELAAVLGELDDALGNRFSFGIVDPDGDEDLAAFAAARGVAPFTAVASEGDRTLRRELWASVVLEWGAHGQARVVDLGPADLPHLQALMRAELAELRAPSEPTIVLLAPAGSVPDLSATSETDPLSYRFGALATALDAIATVVVADPVAEGFDPEVFQAGELVFWLDPEDAAGDLAPHVERAAESGRAVILAGSPFESAPGMNDLCAALGVTLGSAPLERRVPPDVSPEGTVGPTLPSQDLADQPGVVASIAPDQDFRHLVGQPDGSLLFERPAALEFDAVVLQRRASSARRIANTRETETLPKRTLACLLQPDSEHAAPIVVLAASTPLAALTAPGSAHVPLVQTLLDTYISTANRARLSALPPPAPLAPSLDASQRAWLRAATALPLPLALALVLLLRRVRSPNAPTTTPEATPPGALARNIARPRLPFGGRTAALLLSGLALVGALSNWLSQGPRADWSAGELNTPPAVLFEAAGAAGDTLDAPLKATLYASPPSRLPASLATLPAELEALLESLAANSSLQLELTRIFPEALDQTARDALVRSGVQPFPFRGPVGLAGSERRQGFMTLRLAAPEKSPLDLAFESGVEREELAFRLGLALETLARGRAPRVAFASDLPRMSAAEDYEFQAERSFAPREGDVFGRARRLLERAGFEVEHVNPRAQSPPELDVDLDALVWMQPRRDARAMLQAFAGHLAQGGRGLLAAQHFRTQARQYRGDGFDTVFWPQPQLPDIDRFYLPALGIQLERKVRFDASQAELPVVHRMTGRTAATEFAPLVTRAPFLVRVPPGQFRAPTWMTGVGPLDLADPSAILLDQGELKSRGLNATPLFVGSPRSWSLDWQGGWLPHDVLEGAAAYEAPPLFGVLVEGPFPRASALANEDWGDGWPRAEQADSSSAVGALALIGNSAVFTDEALEESPRAGGALLLDLVAGLALEDFGPRGPALAALAGRRPPSRTLALDATERAGPLRIGAILGGGLLVLLISLLARGGVRRLGLRRERRRPFDLGTAGLPWPLGFAALVLGGTALALAPAAPQGDLMFGRLVPAEIRTQELGAVRVTRGATNERWLYGYGGGVWRELYGLGAVGDSERITGLVEDLFGAEGVVWAERTGPAPEYELGADQGWRVELFAAGADPSDESPVLDVEIGLATGAGMGALMRLRGAAEVWHADRNPRYELYGSLDETPGGAPPLADRRSVPTSWPLPVPALETLAWQRAGEKSLRVTRRVAEVTREELEAGASPFVYDLIGDGLVESFPVPLPADLPGASSAPDPVGQALATFQRFAAESEYTELLDPNDAPAWGLGPGAQPHAILVFAWAPSDELPEGLSLTLEIGPERDGAHAAINQGTGNLVRLDAATVAALLPPREAFRSPAWTQRWR